MRFGRTPEQTSFASALSDLLTNADVPTAARAWASGDHQPGLLLGQRLTELGVPALLVPEDAGGLGAGLSDAVVACEALGYHAVPGPWIETVVVAPALLSAVDAKEADQVQHLLSAVADGKALISVAAGSDVAPFAPRALDADIASTTLLVEPTTLSTAILGEHRRSVDPSRHLVDVSAGDPVGTIDQGAVTRALDAGALASAAVLLGAGERLLTEAVTYAGSRTQFGRRIGEFQALKHLAADVRVALDFARPLVDFAALQLQQQAETASRDVSAAKVAAGDAAYLASRTALQMHAAIGYTMECDLSLWLLKVRALVTAWGTPAYHRDRVLVSLAPTSLTASPTSPTLATTSSTGA